MPLLLLLLLLAPFSSTAKDPGELSANLAGLSGGVSDPINETDEIAQFGLAVFTGFDQQSVRRGESVQPR